MRPLIRYTLSLFIFWLIVFIPLRLFFIFYQLPFGERVHATADVWRSFLEGYSLDIATSIVLCGLPVLFVWLFILTRRNTFLRVVRILMPFLLVLYSAVAIADAGLYREWQAKINLQALAHFKNPAEIFKTVSLPLQGVFILLVTLSSVLYYRLYHKKIHRRLLTSQGADQHASTEKKGAPQIPPKRNIEEYRFIGLPSPPKEGAAIPNVRNFNSKRLLSFKAPPSEGFEEAEKTASSYYLGNRPLGGFWGGRKKRAISSEASVCANQEQHRLLPYPSGAYSPRRYWVIFFLPVYAALSVIGIRGGIWNLPISQSVAYFSQDMLVNDMAVNPLYNLLQDVTVQGKIPDRQYYVHYSKEEVNSYLKDYFFVSKDSALSIFSNPHPNIVFLILESWSANEVGCLGGISNATPCLDSLAKDGITFEKAYASAYISDQGIPAILSGYPGLSRISAINQPRVINQLPSISEELHQKKYHTSFLYGGDLVFGNIKGYISAKGYDEITDVRQLSSLPQGQLGVHDEYMFPKLLQQCQQTKEPFLKVLFTLSTHMPYDFTSKENWKAPKGDVEARYSEAIHYSDQAIGRFFSEAKKQPWYHNTVFVLVADHSHNTLRQSDLAQPDRHHIPLFILGGALRDEVRGKIISRVVAQMDIPVTLLKQMKMATTHFPWSRDMLNEGTAPGAYFPFYGGAGFIDNAGFSSGRQMNGGWVSSFSDSVKKEQYGRRAYCFMQKIYEELYKE